MECANERLASNELPTITDGLTFHSLRRTFASRLYRKGEDPVYVMAQMGHTDPRLALRIYTRVIGDQGRRRAGQRLVSVLGGDEWARMGTNSAPAAMTADTLVGMNHETPP